MAFGRQGEDPAARGVLREGSADFTVDLEVEHLHRDFSGHQEVASLLLDVFRHGGARRVEIELRIDRPGDLRAFLPDEAPFHAYRRVAWARFHSPFLVL